MRYRLTGLVLLVLITVFATVPLRAGRQSTASAVDLTGRWAMTLEMSMGTASPALVIKQEGTKVSGVYVGRYGEFPLAGEVKGRTLTFAFAMASDGQPVALTFTADVAPDGQSMAGTADMGDLGDAKWKATREKKEN